MNWKLDLFGLNSIRTAPERDLPERKGVLRYVQVMWDHLGTLLLANVMCFAGFLPAALGISLGLVYENFWLTLGGGIVGGAIAGPVWTAMVDLALRCYQGSTDGWLSSSLRTLLRTWPSAEVQGAVLGCVSAGLLSVGRFCAGLMASGTLPALPVWMVLTFDFALTALAASLLFPPLCFRRQPFSQRLRTAGALLVAQPLRLLAGALAMLLWSALGIALFPVSVPFAVVLGFWPVSLLTVQLQRPALLERLSTPESAASTGGASPRGASYTTGQRGEVWWQRHPWIIIAVLVCVSLALGVAQTVQGVQEPDLQIAIVHSSALPDSVSSALQVSLEAAVGDRNGDGAAVVQVNDYQVVFDGSAEDVDMQAAGSTLLVTDLAGGESSLFIVEDTSGFLALYGDLVDTEDALCWTEYPALAALDAGTYSPVEDIDGEYTGQTLLAGYTVFPLLGEDSAALRTLLEG